MPCRFELLWRLFFYKQLTKQLRDPGCMLRHYVGLCHILMLLT